ncbi:MAG: endonuclease NucS domain-containing protein [Candidatus Kariarchaeaceae archaeon]|jgi:RecB family endonuclease NucS
MINQIMQLSLDPDTLKDQINNLLSESVKMIILLGRCNGLFDGRIKSRIEEGDRILIIKRDSTILLHDPLGVKPIQWQRPKVGPVKFTIHEEHLRMETYRPKTDESFFITFTKLYQAVAYESRKDHQSRGVIIGDEKDFVNYLVNNPSIIEQGLKILEREKVTDVGPVDIFAIDSLENYVVIEVKKQAANPNDAHQLRRYFEYFQNQGIHKLRGILIATAFPKKVKQYLERSNLETCEIPWQEIFPTLERPVSIPRSRNLEEFFD